MNVKHKGIITKQKNCRKLTAILMIMLLCCAFLFDITAYAEVGLSKKAKKAEGIIGGSRTIDYVPPERHIEKKPSEGRGNSRREVTPSMYSRYYSLKDEGLVTSVKDQGTNGTCWAFAFTAMAESSLMRNYNASQSIDLSEQQLAYFIYNNRGVGDPLGNTTWDYNESGDGKDFLEEGGTTYLTAMHLSGYCGLTSESTVPYSSGVPSSYTAYGSNSAVLKNVYFIDSNSSSNIKNALINYGALNGSFFYNDSYLNKSTGAYFSGQSTGQNHNICIIGWDDDYPTYNFNGVRPSSSGAWLVKNSWGASHGTSGYMWISYEEASLDTIVCAEFMPAGTYTHNYHYDGSASLTSSALWSGGSFANIFKVSGNSSGNDELLEAVSFGVDSTDVQYSIQVYTNLDDPSDPYSGVMALDAPVTGTTTYAGIYTVPLNQRVVLSQGTSYSIVVTNKSSDYAYFFVDTTHDYNWVKCNNNVNPKESFLKQTNYSGWNDLYYSDPPGTARIKGLTNDLSTKQSAEEARKPVSKVSNSTISDIMYSGGALLPYIAVWDGDHVLEEGKDYRCEYRDNVEPGTATVKIIGLNRYCGEKEVTFTITPDPEVEKAKAAAAAKAAAEAKAKTVKTVTVNVPTVTAKAISKAIKKKGGKTKYVTKIILGKNVKKISKYAFKNCKKTKTLVIKTKKLKKAYVKNSLKGSKITKIQIRVGSKKLNKKYLKNYKKIFTKKNAGKKVRIVR